MEEIEEVIVGEKVENFSEVVEAADTSAIRTLVAVYLVSVKNVHIQWSSAGGLRVIEFATQLCKKRDEFVRRTTIAMSTSNFETVFRENANQFNPKTKGLSDSRKCRFCLQLIAMMTTISTPSEYRLSDSMCNDAKIAELRTLVAHQSTEIIEKINIFIHPSKIELGTVEIVAQDMKKLEPAGCCFFN